MVQTPTAASESDYEESSEGWVKAHISLFSMYCVAMPRRGNPQHS